MTFFVNKGLQGEISALQVQWKAEAPMLDIKVDGLLETGKNIYQSFVDYAIALYNCVTEQIPAVTQNAEELPSKAEEAKEHAQDQISSLDLMKKGKALMAIGFNIKTLGKVPAFVKNAADGIKGDLQEVKDAITDLKQNLPQVIINGGKCAAQEKYNPVECYKLIYGPIKYTMDQRMEWEAKMKAKMGYTFKPEDYPLTDLMSPEEAAALEQAQTPAKK